MKNQSTGYKSSIARFAATLAVSVMLGTTAFADGTNSKDGKHHHKHMKEVVQACAKAKGVTLPAEGSGDKLSSDDRTKIHACVKEFHDSFKTCASNAGLPKPAPGQWPKLDDSQKAALKQCKTQALAQIVGTPAASK